MTICLVIFCVFSFCVHVITGVIFFHLLRESGDFGHGLDSTDQRITNLFHELEEQFRTLQNSCIDEIKPLVELKERFETLCEMEKADRNAIRRHAEQLTEAQKYLNGRLNKIDGRLNEIDIKFEVIFDAGGFSFPSGEIAPLVQPDRSGPGTGAEHLKAPRMTRREINDGFHGLANKAYEAAIRSGAFRLPDDDAPKDSEDLIEYARRRPPLCEPIDAVRDDSFLLNPEDDPFNG